MGKETQAHYKIPKFCIPAPVNCVTMQLSDLFGFEFPQL